MKTSLLLLTMTLTAFSAQAFQPGSYSCKTADGLDQSNIKIESVNMGGVQVAALEITRSSTRDGALKSYTVKGIAMAASDNSGNESLSLGANNVQLKDGRPACAQ